MELPHHMVHFKQVYEELLKKYMNKLPHHMVHFKPGLTNTVIMSVYINICMGGFCQESDNGFSI